VLSVAQWHSPSVHGSYLLLLSVVAVPVQYEHSCTSPSVFPLPYMLPLFYQLCIMAKDKTENRLLHTFLVHRSSTMERTSTQTMAAGILLQLLQTISENSSLWQVKQLVTLLNYRRYINNFICLSLYLSISQYQTLKPS